MRTAISRLMTVAAPAALVVASLVAQAPATITVTASYTGKGKVDETHEILVFLFDHPVPTTESVPLAVQPVTKNGGVATFTVTRQAAQPVYVLMVYDEKANYDGTSPPPEGTPIGTYSKAGKPIPVTPGPNVKVTASFDDSKRWAQ